MTIMFGDLLETWDYLSENRGADPTAQRLGFRLAKGITKKAKEQPRRGTIIKSLGMKMVGGDKKKPPPSPVPVGTKLGKVDLVGSKEESFFAGELYFWEDCGCGCKGKKGGCGKGMKAYKD